jgi:hypothetical protein
MQREDTYLAKRTAGGSPGAIAAKPNLKKSMSIRNMMRDKVTSVGQGKQKVAVQTESVSINYLSLCFSDVDSERDYQKEVKLRYEQLFRRILYGTTVFILVTIVKPYNQGIVKPHITASSTLH